MSEPNLEVPYTMEIPAAQLLVPPSVNVIELEEHYPEVQAITKSYEGESGLRDMPPNSLNMIRGDMPPSGLHLTRFVKTNQLWWRGPYERSSGNTIVCDRREGCGISRTFSHTFSYSSSVSLSAALFEKVSATFNFTWTNSWTDSETMTFNLRYGEKGYIGVSGVYFKVWGYIEEIVGQRTYKTDVELTIPDPNAYKQGDVGETRWKFIDN